MAQMPESMTVNLLPSEQLIELISLLRNALERTNIIEESNIFAEIAKHNGYIQLTPGQFYGLYIDVFINGDQYARHTNIERNLMIDSSIDYVKLELTRMWKEIKEEAGINGL